MKKNQSKLLFLLVSLILSACGGGGGGSGNGVISPSGGGSSEGYTISGTVTGLASGQQVTLLDNGGDALTVSSNAAISFTDTIPQNGSYAVTVAAQPAGEVCTIANGTGAGVVANISNVKVVCSADTYTLTYNVSGLASGQQFTLLDNSADPQVISHSGTGSFDVPVAYGGDYTVTVNPQPTGQTCTVSNGTGSHVSANVTNIDVVCSTASYSISGNVSGLNAGNQVTLRNNQTNSTTVVSNGAFSFSTPVAYGANYSVDVGIQPVGGVCSVSNANGTVAGNVNHVAVNCVSGPLAIIASHSEGNGNSLGVNSPLAQVDDATLYVTTEGTVPCDHVDCGILASYSLTTNQITILHTFTGTDGALPLGGVAANDGNFYGVTYQGGANNGGTLYMVNLGTQQFTHLYDFAASSNDGAGPNRGLIQANDGNLYGTTATGGLGHGTIFRFNMTSKAIEILYSFQNAQDGARPTSGLVQGMNHILYGVTSGTLFMFDTATMQISTLHNFSAADGADPITPIVGAGGNLYGVASGEGQGNSGTIFSFNLNQAKFQVLHSFVAATEGGNPGGLVQGPDGNFYGSNATSGPASQGTLFEYSPTSGLVTVLGSFGGSSVAANAPTAPIIASDGYIYGGTFQADTGPLSIYRY